MSEPKPVLETLDRLTAAWNAGDATAYGAEFTADATYVAFNGQVMVGRGVIEDTHRYLFEGPLRGSRMTSASEEQASPGAVRFLRPDVAHVITTGAVIPAEQPAVTADRESVLSFVVTDDGDTWRVTALQNTRRHDPATAER